ncbi:YetF domain-containing protein [Cohnella yongneupensis]|uniref:YetF domain-containing protein n=1 Tax=Cohnella yongneupensis TaxID=425006 RepID=A0ABW0QSX2_9BACL
MRTVWIGKSIPIIAGGKLERGAMESLKLTDEELDAQLRIAGAFDRADVEFATIEANGHLTVQLKPHKAPATKQDIEQLKQLIELQYSASLCKTNNGVEGQ